LGLLQVLSSSLIQCSRSILAWRWQLHESESYEDHQEQRKKEKKKKGKKILRPSPGAVDNCPLHKSVQGNVAAQGSFVLISDPAVVDSQASLLVPEP
jgi:hypothetical protein